MSTKILRDIEFLLRFWLYPFIYYFRIDQDEAFNVNLAIFLSQLKAFKQSTELSISHTTLNMLSETIYTTDSIIESAQVKASDENNVDFIFNLPTDLFKIRPYISCRLCSDLILATKDDFEAHVQKSAHKCAEDNEKAMSELSRLFPKSVDHNQNVVGGAVVWILFPIFAYTMEFVIWLHYECFSYRIEVT